MSRRAAKRPKNFTRLSRTMTGGADGTVAINGSLMGVWLLSHRLRRARCRISRLSGLRGRSGSGLSRLLGGVFGRAFGLNVGGVEDAIAAKLTLGQCLGIVLEGVRRSLGAAVDHGQRAALLHQQEFQMRALPLD